MEGIRRHIVGQMQPKLRKLHGKLLQIGGDLLLLGFALSDAAVLQDLHHHRAVKSDAGGVGAVLLQGLPGTAAVVLVKQTGVDPGDDPQGTLFRNVAQRRIEQQIVLNVVLTAAFKEFGQAVQHQQTAGTGVSRSKGVHSGGQLALIQASGALDIRPHLKRRGAVQRLSDNVA